MKHLFSNLVLFAGPGVVLLAFLLEHAAWGTAAPKAKEIYVSPSGSDRAGAGTLSKPYATVARAILESRPGDTITLRGGTYAGGIAVVQPAVTLRSYPGEWAVIRSPTDDPAAGSTIRFEADAHGCKLQRLELVGGEYYSVKTETHWESGAAPRPGASKLLIEDCKLHGSGRDVIKITPGCDDIVIRRCEIYNSGRRDPSNAEGIDNTNGDRMVVQDCYIHDIATTGVYPKGGSIGSVIERNLLLNIGGLGIEVGQTTDYPYLDLVANPGLYENIDGIVRNNIIVKTGYAGIGLQGSLRAQVYNNTLVNVAERGHPGILFRSIDQQPPSGKAVIVGNKDAAVINNLVVLAAASDSPLIDIREAGVTGTLTLSHNRYYTSRGRARFSDQRGGNGFFGDLAGWQRHVGGDARSTEGDPQLDRHYHLAAGSPLIDAGRKLSAVADDFDTQRRTGTPDIGADESATGPALPVPPPPGTIGTGGKGASVAPAIGPDLKPRPERRP
jgi:hypothetical protein